MAHDKALQLGIDNKVSGTATHQGKVTGTEAS
jgi:hypothetical protein